MKEPAARRRSRAARRRSAQPDDEPDPAAPARMTVAGRVLDPDGKPVKGAVVDLVTRLRTPVGRRRATRPTGSTLLGQGQSDGDGRFRSTRPARRRAASSRSTRWPPRPGTDSAGPS